LISAAHSDVSFLILEVLLHCHELYEKVPVSRDGAHSNLVNIKKGVEINLDLFKRVNEIVVALLDVLVSVIPILIHLLNIQLSKHFSVELAALIGKHSLYFVKLAFLQPQINIFVLVDQIFHKIMDPFEVKVFWLLFQLLENCVFDLQHLFHLGVSHKAKAYQFIFFFVVRFCSEVRCIIRILIQ
jgi:hypothetical protein